MPPSTFEDKSSGETFPACKASVFSRKGSIFVQSNAKTDEGISTLYGPVHTLAWDEPEALGRIVKELLAQPLKIVQHPSIVEKVDYGAELLVAAKVETWSQLRKGCVEVFVNDYGSHIDLKRGVDDSTKRTLYEDSPATLRHLERTAPPLEFGQKCLELLVPLEIFRQNHGL